MTKIHTSYDQRWVQANLPLAEIKSFNCSAGSFRRKEAVQEALCRALKRSMLSREEVADEMFRLVGEKISVSHIANWTAESKNGWRLPLEYTAALTHILNDTGIVKAALLGSGINILDDKEMALYEIGKAIEDKRENDAKLRESRDRLKQLQLMRGGR
ncbi:MAG: hypothetical protein KKH99_00180 [Proteobacteria bacterium]|nr:hypothetical protein [Pseudomonadota bacterium]